MEAKELVKGETYYCERLKADVKYCGTQDYEGKTYHNFWEDGIRLFYWLDPDEVQQPSQPDRGQG